MDMMLPQPSKKADKTGVDLQNICADDTILSLELKRGPVYGIGKYAAGMVLQLRGMIIQHQYRLTGRRL